MSMFVTNGRVESSAFIRLDKHATRIRNKTLRCSKDDKLSLILQYTGHSKINKSHLTPFLSYFMPIMSIKPLQTKLKDVIERNMTIR